MGFYITQASGEKEHIRYRKSTERGEITVRDCVMEGVELRLLLVRDVQESAVFLEREKRHDAPFRYIDSFMDIVAKHPHPDRVLLIGGAGFAFPRTFFGSGQKGTLDVVELDPRMVKLARRFFFLDDLEREFDLKKNGRLNIHIQDGTEYLESTDEKYDIILNDAYIGNTPDRGLSSDDGMALCRAHLKEGGILVVNVITTLIGEGSMPGIISRNAMEGYFDHVTLYPCNPSMHELCRQNCMLVGTV